MSHGKSRSSLALRFSLLVMLMALLCSLLSVAQTTVATGSIVGTVTDQSGAVVSGAKVDITNQATGQTISLTSNSAGAFNSGSLNPGNYKVQVSAKGFSTVVTNTTVLVNNTATVNAKLQVGRESETIEVQAADVQVNTEQAEVQGVLNASQIENLPVNGRNFLDLAQLEPGVQIQDGTNFDPTKVGYSSISFGGRFGRTARINVDGVDVSDETVGTTTEDIPASGIQEFSLAQSNLDLSNDLTSSGAVNVITRSGTNLFHGEGFELFRDSRVGAAPLPHPPGLDAPFQRNQYGGRLGGPIKKDKLFFFLDGERTLQHLQAPVLEVNQGGPGTPGNFAGFSGTFPAPFKESNLMGRLDYTISNSAKVFYRYTYFDNSTFATFFPSSFQVYNNKDYTRQNVVGLDFNTGSSMSHSIRFSYLKFQNQIVDATKGTSLPFANFPVSINIGPLSTGPNLLAPQSTPQSNRQLKYDGSKTFGRHILRYGASYNHIQGGGFASFFGTTANVFGSPSSLAPACSVPNPPAAICPVGADGTPASNPLSYENQLTIIGTGQGFSTENPALGFPAGGLGPDNRVGLYIGDSWKIRHNLTLTAGLRWDRDTGRTDSDLGPIPELNAAFPGYGNRVRNPNTNFAPQLGIAWDPRSNGKTVIRAGIGLFYENVIFNNVLFDRPLRLKEGAFLFTPTVCFNGSEVPVSTSQGNLSLAAGTCSEPIGESAQTIANFQSQIQSITPFNLKAPNAAYVGTLLAAGQDVGLGLFAPNYRSPRSLQMNVGFQHEIRHGMVFSADYLRNVTTHLLLGIDVNHAGDVRFFNKAAAQQAINNTIIDCGAASLAAAIGPGGCPGLHPATAGSPAGSATIADFASLGLTEPQDSGGACGSNAFDPISGNALGYPCAFGGINPQFGAMPVLFPVGRSVYNGLQMKLSQNVQNPVRGVKAINFQISYALSRFVNPGGFQGNTPPSNPVAAGDQDFVLQAMDNNNPNRYTGPSLLDRTHQISFGGYFDLPAGLRFGLISHFYSPLSSPVIIGNTGSAGNIFLTDFTGDGTVSDPMPGTKQGSFGRDFGVSGLTSAINNYNSTVANQPTPAGQALVSSGLFSVSQLQTIGAVAPTITAPVAGQVPFQWLRALDLNLKWRHTFRERFTIEPSVAFFNVFNFNNFDLPPGVMTGWLNSGSGSINTTTKATDFRVGQGTGVFGLGAPRVMEMGMRFEF
jgi:hypothetical protein